MIGAMARRPRVGSSHYISGFGDGKVSSTEAHRPTVAYLRRSANPQDASVATADADPSENSKQPPRSKHRTKRIDDDLNFPVRDYRRKHFEGGGGGAGGTSDVRYAGQPHGHADNRLGLSSVAEDYGRGWGLYEGQSTYDSNGGGGAREQFQSSAVVLMAAVVFMSALFLHLISDTTEKNHLRRRRRHHRPLIVKNKKTDEWIDDAEEDSLEEQRQQRQPQPQQHTAATAKSTAEASATPGVPPPRPPAVYYHPYQPRQRQRMVPSSTSSNKNTATTAAAASATTSSTAAASASGPSIASRGQQQQQQPPSVSNAAPPAPAPQQQVNGEVYQAASNYYMLSSSGGTPSQFRTSGMVEPPLSPPRVDLMTTTAAATAATTRLGGGYQSRTPPMQLQQRLSPRPQQASPGHTASPGQQQQQPTYYLPPAQPPRAVALPTDVSSFGSLTEAVAPRPPPPIRENDTTTTPAKTPADEEIGYSRKNSPPFEPKLKAPSSKSPILLSPGTEDVEETVVIRRGRKKSWGGGSDQQQQQLVDTTPRVANRKLHAPAAAQGLLIAPPQFPVTDEVSEPSAASSAMAFASPPPNAPVRKRSQSKRQQQEQVKDEEEEEDELSPTGIPYVPNLAVPDLDHHQNKKNITPNLHSQPPRSINIHELQLYRMESGNNVSHWHARVAEETRTIQDRVFAAASLRSSGIEALMNSNGNDDGDVDVTDSSIPSNDPRGGIDHKRDDLTMDTDSAASLQGAIDFDKLELIEVIGGGGFGQVWKAKLRGTPVAVKVLTGSAQAKQVPRAVLEEFAAEINLLRGMQHPNICLYMGACVKPPNRAIVTELAANGSLWDALRLPLNAPYQPCDGVSSKGWPLSLYAPDARHGVPPTPESGRRLMPVPPRYTWPWKLVKKVALGVARGMAYLHSGVPPVLHRDLKSANILLDESYNPKVCDFGLSRLKAHERSMTGNCGTVQWMAPEVLASKPYNEKADIYSYGIICWELLSRQCPYDEMSAIQCALAVLNRNKRPEIPRWCPPALHAIIRSCVKKDPTERLTFEEIIQALDAMPDE